MTTPPIQDLTKSKEYWNKRAALFAVITIVLAWFIGFSINNTPLPDCRNVLADAEICKPLGNDVFEGVISNDDRTETVVGWATLSEAPGYAGPVKVMVGVSPTGDIQGVFVIAHTETPSYFSKITRAGFTDEFIGRQANSPFHLGEDVEAVSRATITSHAISEAVQSASYTIAETQLGLVVDRAKEQIKFGVPEITVLGLYVVGYIGHQRNFRYKKIARWLSLIIGMVVLGFIYNIPVTVAHFNSLLLGFLPNWQNNLYWFLLVGGILFVVTVDSKNPYCQWFCPFGAAQECLGAIGGARLWSPGRTLRQNLQWIQRGLAWSAIVLGLITRKPGFSSYEIFGGLFSFTGTWPQWAILVIILLLSLFIKRPWCTYLCPIDPIVDFVQSSRRWLKQEVSKWQKKTVLEENS